MDAQAEALSEAQHSGGKELLLLALLLLLLPCTTATTACRKLSGAQWTSEAVRDVR
jgi:hypothetical protein